MKSRPHAVILFFSMVLSLVGMALAIGGAYLIWLDGSWYYAPAGLGLIISAYLLFKDRIAGIWVYLVVSALSILWALIEVGFNFWPLVPRTVMFIFLGAIALMIVPFLKGDRPKNTRGFVLGGVMLAFGFIAYFAMMFQPHDIVRNDFTVKSGQATTATHDAGNNWISYSRTGEGVRYAPFDQINRSNIHELEVAWIARTGDIANQAENKQDQNTPLFIDGTLYQCSATSRVTALNGSTGEILWQFNPEADSPFWKRCRTLGYYDPGENDDCGPRIILATIDTRLISLRTADGTMCESFGKNGVVDLAEGMGEVMPGFLVPTTGPFVAGDKIVLGSWVADNVSVGEPSGAVRAYDAKTGVQIWAWDLGNPSITNLPPAGETYTRGTPNVWTAMAFDLDLNMVYLPLGNATPDYYGGKRRDFDDEYNSSVVALDLDTGRHVWHFRTINHDIWDYDLPAQPALVDMPDGNGGTTPALIQITKRGQIFVLDRRTGEPVTKVEQRQVPKGDGTAEGEYYAETQPYSVGMPAIGTEPLSEKRMWGATPIDHMLCRISFKQARYDGEFTTQSLKETIIYPGNNGGFNWGSAAVDQERNMLIVNDMRVPVSAHLIPREDIDPNAKLDAHASVSTMFGLPYGHKLVNYMSPIGIPCLEPPWGTISGIDLASRQLIWQQPTGTAKDFTIGTIQPQLGFFVGMPSLGGPMTTKGGIVFHGGTQDYYLRAYDVETGKVLWQSRLPSGAQSTPMTYIDEHGRQFVVTTASGARYNPSDWGDYIVAFALPNKK